MKHFSIPAFPLHPTKDKDYTQTNGLTKREYFAAAALTGYAAAGSTGMPSAKDLANYAVEAADAIIQRLNETI